MIEGLDQTVEAWLVHFVNHLHTSAVIDVGYGRHARTGHIHSATQLDERLMKLDPRTRLDYGLDLTELSSAYQAVGNLVEAANTMERDANVPKP